MNNKNGNRVWKVEFIKRHIQNVNLSTTTLSIESVLNCGIELVKEKEKKNESKNKPLQEKIGKQTEIITALEKEEKENNQKIEQLQSKNKAIAGFTQFSIYSF